MTTKTTITRNPKLAVCHLDDGITHVTIDGYEIVKTGERITTRVADIYLYDDGFEAGHVASYDEDGRCVRDTVMDEKVLHEVIRDLRLWDYAA